MSMRPIKFRAWDKENKKMLRQVTSSFGFRAQEQGIQYIVLFENDRVKSRSAENMQLMQYTGLKDKNGKEIYEGDVVKGREGMIKGVVEFGAYTKVREHKHDSQTEHVGWYVLTRDGKDSLEDLEWYIKPDTYAPFRGSYLEVIGNVYENPELLK